MTEKSIVDCRGMTCPQPVIETKNALDGATGPLLVIVDNESSCTNVTRFAQSQGARVTEKQRGGEFHLTIEPGQDAPDTETPAVVCEPTGARDMVVFISSEGVGQGDEELGAILMAAFLDTLSQFKDELSCLIFVNAGAKLTVEGSPVLGQLRALEDIGARVLVCGTCLSYFGIAEKLAVGSVSNMYAIIETLSKAGRIIRP